MKTSETEPAETEPAEIEPAAATQAGFTLIELLVTLVLAGLLLAIVPAASGRGNDKARLATAARSVAAALSLARSEAVMRNAEAGFVLDLDRRRFGLAGRALDGTLDAGLSVDLLAAGAPGGGRRGTIRFYPNGGSDGGAVTLRNPAGGVTIRVDWLSGRVTTTPWPSSAPEGAPRASAGRGEAGTAAFAAPRGTG